MPPYELQVEMLDKFLKTAKDQVGDKYRYGAEASEGDANPTAFDSSELVEWAAHRAGYHDMPDGSVEQYKFLLDQDAAVEVGEALRTPGALVFGFSSDPTAADRPARAYVAISVGDGKNVIDVSERAGEVKVMPAGDFYHYGAKIPDFHGLPDSIGIDTDGDGIPDASLRRPFFPGDVDTNGDGIPDSSVPVPEPTDPIDWDSLRRDGLKMDDKTTVPGSIPPDEDPVNPSAPARPHGQSSQIEPVAEPDDVEAVASYVGEPSPEDQLGYPADDGYPADEGYPADDGGVAQAEPALTAAATETTAYADASDFSASDAGAAGDGASTYSDSYADSYDLSADV